MVKFFRSLNERDRRRYAAVEAAKLGHRGIEYVSQLLGCDPKTIGRGIAELQSEDDLTMDGQRKNKVGRKPLIETSPQLVDNFLAVLRDHTAGDPMREDVKWTNLSRRQISSRLMELGTPAGKNVVSRLLHEHGYRRRKPQKKRTMGQHADRNAQFERITELKQAYLAAGNPVISIDTKKKEMLGNFHRDGVTDAVEPTITISPAVATANSFLMAFTTFTRTKRHCI